MVNHFNVLDKKDVKQIFFIPRYEEIFLRLISSDPEMWRKTFFEKYKKFLQYRFFVYLYSDA